MPRTPTLAAARTLIRKVSPTCDRAQRRSYEEWSDDAATGQHGKASSRRAKLRAATSQRTAVIRGASRKKKVVGVAAAAGLVAGGTTAGVLLRRKRKG